MYFQRVDGRNQKAENFPKRYASTTHEQSRRSETIPEHLSNQESERNENWHLNSLCVDFHNLYFGHLISIRFRFKSQHTSTSRPVWIGSGRQQNARPSEPPPSILPATPASGSSLLPFPGSE